MKKKALLFVLLIAIGSLPAFSQTTATKRKLTKKETEVKKIDYSEVYKDEWLLYASTKYSNFYYNPGKALREGSVMRIWSVVRDKSDGATISKTFYEIRCESNKVRMLASAVYFEIIYTAGGDRQRLAIRPESFDTPEASFRTVVPDTPIEDLYYIACKDEW
jgi:hypothetical protein